MALQAKNAELKTWADDFIAAQEKNPDPSVSEAFKVTRARIGQLKERAK